ncbi:MarR family transcriptional regulator [Streptomyces sp. NPDC055287]
MEQPTVSGAVHDPSGAKFTIVGVSNMPTDWAQVFRAVANGDLDIAMLAEGGHDAGRTAARGSSNPAGTFNASGGQAKVSGSRPMSMTPPGVLNLNAYLMYATGKAARRRLTERLTAHGMRLWHLTVLSLLADLGPQSKGDLAARLDMNQSDLVKITNDLEKAGYADCARDPADRRRVEVTLTSEGRSALTYLNADISAVDDDLLAPLTEAERAQLGALLRRLHAHLEPAPSSVIRGSAELKQGPTRAGSLRKHSIEDSRIDWNLPAEEVLRLVRAQSHAHPSAYTHYNGKRLEILAATVSEGQYSGSPGHISWREDDGVVIVAGAGAHTSGTYGLAITRVRTEDGEEMAAADYFRSTGGHVTTDN